MKVFVDTNIFLDLILKRENFENALLIFNAIEKKYYFGVVLDITLLNIDYVANKQVKDVKAFLRLVNSVFEVVGGNNKMFHDALSLKNDDLEDSLQYVSAQKMVCDVIVTNDQNFYAEGIETLTSSTFVKKYFK
ncbi:PIN domain-containing protein [Sulfurovum sp.]|uniref:type II toxin-antitoxin system VapC family toxin n=1 Tax=Sulfurovum sp. TaxID=1969726 RepID=UPI0025FFE71F|nr:PIN domain-containing protein [Sulfurovum sp.]